jgi:hypothetical protein
MSVLPDALLGRAGAPALPGSGSARQLRVMAVLNTIFNVMALNGVLVIACLPIITAPAALQSAMVALDGWRSDGDDRVVRQFIVALRACRFGRTTVTVGLPLVAAALAAEEVIYFSRAANAGNAVGFGLGVAGLLLALSSIGYLLMLGARQPDLPPTDAWFVAISLVARNLLVASPLLAGIGAVGLLVLTRDPPLAVVGIPVGLLALVRQAGLRGLERMPELIALDAETDSHTDPGDREVER